MILARLFSFSDVQADCGNYAKCLADAEQGDAEAQAGLGSNYQFGSGVTQNFKEAVRWYRKAAEQGHSIAQNNLAAM